jgi:hypothetical protein
MLEYTEISVDEDLLISVVRELLEMAADANQVKVEHGVGGRVILAEVHLAEHWYQKRLKQQEPVVEASEPAPAPAPQVTSPAVPQVPAEAKVEPSKTTRPVPVEAETRASQPQVSASATVAASSTVSPSIAVPEVKVAQPQVPASTTVEPSNIAARASDAAPLPVKRGPGRPRNVPQPSASPDGEDS